MDLNKFKALYNLQILVLGNAINYPLPNWFLLLIDYIYSIERPLNILINYSVT